MIISTRAPTLLDAPPVDHCDAERFKDWNGNLIFISTCSASTFGNVCKSKSRIQLARLA
jgi:hypothetical protein